ncbi:MAG: hypothetical protein SWK76_15930 [Actinomycetota bacterium]|nr:hypothetical protein [Actinomycetota bacterium]
MRGKSEAASRGEARRLREEKKKRKRKRRRRLVFLALLAPPLIAAVQYLRRTPTGSGEVTFEDEDPSGLAFMIGQMLMAFLKDPSKKSIADRMRLVLAIQDMENPDMAVTLTFNGSDVNLNNGVSPDAQVYLGLELSLLLKMANMGRGLEAIKFFRSDEGKEIIDAYKSGKIRMSGVITCPVQMMQFGMLMAPPRQSA